MRLIVAAPSVGRIVSMPEVGAGCITDTTEVPLRIRRMRFLGRTGDVCMLRLIQVRAVRFMSIHRGSKSRSVGLLAGLALLGILAIVPGGLLLCVGPDAHLDLEIQHKGSACHNPDGDLTISQTCVDFALQADFTEFRRFDAQLSAHAFSVRPIVTVPSSPPRIVCSDAARSPCPSTLPAHRTIVLRI